MKMYRFKSLTMRIWVTFTAVILLIIFCTSFLYLFAYKSITENARIQDLKVAHEILLSNTDYNQVDMFNNLKNLKGSGQFTVTIKNDKKEIRDIGKRPDMPEDRGPMGAPGPAVSYDVRTSELWMTEFIGSGDIKEKQYKETFTGTKFIFIISSVNNSAGKSYLISYMPETADNSLLYIVIGIGLLFIFIGFITAKIVATRIAKPLKELEDYTVRIAQKDWKEPIKIESRDEIGRLANSMNRMQKELKTADEEEKMFLQSISHDLKTPVMVILSHAAAIIDGVYAESVENTAEIIKNEALSLEKKIKQMLYLNTLDYVMANNSATDNINLHDLLLNIINRFEAIKSEIEWDLDIDHVNIEGNIEKIQVAIENIVDNALRYAESKIKISLKEQDGRAVLEIYNDGKSIDKNNINKIFDSLYKDKTGNFGLGLAISKKIINFYNGEIKAVNRDKGVSFIIIL